MIPAGWKLVPIEPTEDMVNVNPRMLHPRLAAAIYEAMLAVAPEAPSIASDEMPKTIKPAGYRYWLWIDDQTCDVRYIGGPKRKQVFGIPGKDHGGEERCRPFYFDAPPAK